MFVLNTHITVMSDYGLCHILKHKWTTKFNSFSPKFWKEDKCCFKEVHFLTNNSNAYEDCHLFVLPWVTDLDKLSFCWYPHYSTSCWSFAISSLWYLCPLPDILQFLFSLRSTLLRHVLKRPPLFPTLNLWNLSCPSRHINLDSTSDLSENRLKLLRMQSSPQTASFTPITQHFLESCGIAVPVTKNFLAFFSIK